MTALLHLGVLRCCFPEIRSFSNGCWNIILYLIIYFNGMMCATFLVSTHVVDSRNFIIGRNLDVSNEDLPELFPLPVASSYNIFLNDEQEMFFH